MTIAFLVGIFGLFIDAAGLWFLAKGLTKKTRDMIINEAHNISFGINI